MWIMTRSGWQPLYEPLPTWALTGTSADPTRKGVRFTFEYFRGHREAALKRAQQFSKATGCTVSLHRS